MTAAYVADTVKKFGCEILLLECQAAFYCYMAGICKIVAAAVVEPMLRFKLKPRIVRGARAIVPDKIVKKLKRQLIERTSSVMIRILTLFELL